MEKVTEAASRVAGIETKRRRLWWLHSEQVSLRFSPFGVPPSERSILLCMWEPGQQVQRGNPARKEADRPGNGVLSWEGTAGTLPGGDPRAPLPARRHRPEHQTLPTGGASLFIVPLGFCWSCDAPHGDGRESTPQGSSRVSPHLQGQRRRCAPSPGGPGKLAAQAPDARRPRAPGACCQTGGSAAWLVGKAGEGQGWSRNG